MNINKHTPKPQRRKSCKIHTRFDLNAATAFGGSVGLIDFVLKSGIRNHFRTKGLHKRKDARYQMDDIALTLLLGHLLGQERISHFEDIEQDPLLSLKLALPKLPDFTLLYEDLKRLGKSSNFESVRSAQRQVLRSLLGEKKSVVVDIDSSVDTVYGHQEGAGVGYNPHHHGRASFHPLLAFESESGCALYEELRSGDAHTAEGFASFYEGLKRQLPSGVSIGVVRMDKGFTGEKVFETLETDAQDYVIKMKWTKPLAEIATTLKWKCLTPNDDTQHIDVASTTYQATTWKKPRRVVFVRKLDIDPQEVLCADWFWEYEAIVTTLDWDAEDVWRFYNFRGNAENHIKEAKYGFAIDQFSSRDFGANQAQHSLKLLAYNLMLLYKHTELKPGVRNWTANRLRRSLMFLPGILVHHARRWSIRLPKHTQERTEKMLLAVT